MKISDLNSSGISGLAPGSATPASGVGAYGQAARGIYGQTADQVQLSGASRLAASALAAHSARLSQLKDLVAAGQYDPSSEAIGNALLNETLSRTLIK